MSTPRPVREVTTAHRQREGAGFVVRRPFPSTGRGPVDPFLMLDEMGPVVYGPGEALGAPDHPHRGFETVTYLLDGEAEHADSQGHAGTLRAGDVQWMTAGDGVVHREMPSARIREQGGRVHGFQLWVNLPRRLKRTPPRYQELRAADIPRIELDQGRVEIVVIAGETLGVSAPARTHTPITYLHVRLDPSGHAQVPVPVDEAMAAYVFEGSVHLAGTSVREGQLAILGPGDTVELQAEGKAQLLLLGGEPIGEPIAWHGPFVLNTQQELVEAFRDAQEGRMGTIPPEIVRS